MVSPSADSFPGAPVPVCCADVGRRDRDCNSLLLLFQTQFALSHFGSKQIPAQQLRTPAQRMPCNAAVKDDLCRLDATEVSAEVLFV